VEAGHLSGTQAVTGEARRAHYFGAIGHSATRLSHHDAIITITFAVVAFSVFAQGLTITPLLRRLRQIKEVPSH